jgi:hypothetical protein
VDVHTAAPSAANSSLEINTVGPVAAGNKSHTANRQWQQPYEGMEIIHRQMEHAGRRWLEVDSEAARTWIVRSDLLNPP